MSKSVKSRRKVKNILVSVLLDESGSMNGCVKETISGFNEYLQSLQDKKDNKYFLTLTKFNTRHTTIVYSGVPIKDVKPLDNNNYKPDGLTPLYDAIGSTLCDIDKTLNSNKSMDGVFVVIITDGEENSSKEYTRKKIFDMIDANRKKGYTFVYLGANQDSWLSSEGIGIHASNTINFSTRDIGSAYSGLITATLSYSKSCGIGITNPSEILNVFNGAKDISSYNNSQKNKDKLTLKQK